MYNTEIKTPKYYKAGIYIRLSEADEKKSYESESESIINQRSLLKGFVKDKGFILAGEYVDDGFTGTNFARPGFEKLIEDIEKGIINLVIVKDLSRLGRDHVNTGYYMETFFPENRIRFISIQENYDSNNEFSNDSATFILASNDYYSRQNSVKIRSVLNDKRRKGKFIGSKPSFGFKRDPEDKGHLLIDEIYGPIVKKIFDMAYEGIGISEITTYLNDNKIKSPSSLKRVNPNANSKYNEKWTISSVRKILQNRMYTGDMVQRVQAKVSYKSKKKVTLPESCRYIVEDTHEAIVDKVIFNAVQSSMKSTKRTVKVKRDKRLFENLIYCKECGNTLTVSYRESKDYWTVNCNKYSRDPKRKLCESHFMPYNKLEEVLLETIINTCKNKLNEINIKDIANKLSSKEEKVEKLKNHIKDLEKKEKNFLAKLDLLYEDRFKGTITEETYKRIAKDTEASLGTLKKEINKLKSKENKPEPNNNELEKIIKKMIDIEKPTRDLMMTLIEKIIIDKDKNIEIIYKFNQL